MRPEYVLISERLVQEIVDRAAKSGVRVKDFQIRPPFSGLTAGKNDPVGNYHVLAEQIETVLHDQTGTTDYPGEYIGARADFRGWLFTFDYERTPVVWLAAAWSGNLLVLCGSARNVIGYEAGPQHPGWRPSASGGLRDVVAALRKKDPKDLIGYEADAAKQRKMASDAAWITHGLIDHTQPEIEEQLDVLLKPYVHVEDFQARYITGLEVAYDRVIVGAPLWARHITELPPPGEKQ